MKLDLYYRVRTMNSVLPDIPEYTKNQRIGKIVQDQAQLAALEVGESRVVLVEVSNVAEYYCASSQQKFDFSDDFPHLLVPFPACFMFWNLPLSMSTANGVVLEAPRGDWAQQGLLVQTLDIGTEGGKKTLQNSLKTSMGKEGIEGTMLGQIYHDKSIGAEVKTVLANSRFIARVITWIANKATKGVPVCIPCFSFFFLGHQGEYVRHFHIVLGGVSQGSSTTLLQNIVQTGYHVMGLAASFLHCKNVDVSRSTPSTPSAKWTRRKRVSRVEYKTLVIEPMKKILQTKGESGRVGLKKALHICRGHFATYTEESPLFGKYVGTVWKSQHVRGNHNEGEIKKDYEVRAK